MQCATFVLDPKMEISTKGNPQNGRKKSAKRTQKTANKRNLKKCFEISGDFPWFGQLPHQFASACSSIDLRPGAATEWQLLGGAAFWERRKSPWTRACSFSGKIPLSLVAIWSCKFRTTCMSCVHAWNMHGYLNLSCVNMHTLIVSVVHVLHARKKWSWYQSCKQQFRKRSLPQLLHRHQLWLALLRQAFSWKFADFLRPLFRMLRIFCGPFFWDVADVLRPLF